MGDVVLAHGPGLARLLRAPDADLAGSPGPRVARRPQVAPRVNPRFLWENLSMAADRYVYDFDETADGGRELLGGKGIGLAEMTQLGVPVPAGFTITTDACRAYMATGGEVPDGRDEEVDAHVVALEQKSGKKFGDPEDPLLVSVRSGAAVSMPGMMDTILNLGLNDDAARGLAERTGNARFANDSYRRLIQMYGEVVDGIPGHLFEDALS